MSDSLSTKDEIRQKMRDRRKAVSADTRRTAGKTVSREVAGDAIRLLLHARRVCIYLSTKNEIPTRYIARAIWEAGCEVCVPVWSKTDEVYKLCLLEPHMRLIPGHHGIHEPAVRLPVMPWDVDAFILPGLAFDTQGGRLGYGAGHYDKILAKANKRSLKIAVGYDWQVLDTPLPQDSHDVPMDWIVTDTRVIRCSDNRQARRTQSGNEREGNFQRSTLNAHLTSSDGRDKG